METPINESRLAAVSKVTGLSYENMILVMLNWVAYNLFKTLKNRRFVEGMLFWDVTERGVTKPFSVLQLLCFTIPNKVVFKSVWSGKPFNGSSNWASFEKYVEDLYLQLKDYSNDFQLKLINPKTQ